MATQTDTTEAPKRRGRPPKVRSEGEPVTPAGGEVTAPPPTVDPRKRAVRVRASVLRGALKDVLGAVAAKATIPILSHVLFAASSGRIELTASDLDLWAERDCATDDRDGPGSADWVQSIRPFTVTLPAKPLADILGEFDPDAMVTVSIDTAAGEGELEEAWKGQATIAAGRARFRLHCLPAIDFPRPQGFSHSACFELHCSALADAFARVEHAISSEETRYYLNGILLHTYQAEGEAQELRFVTTDGHRLARLRVDPPEGAASFPAAILSRNTVALLDRLLGAAAKAEGDENNAQANVLVEIAGETPGALLRFSLPASDGGEITVTAKSIDGTFPDYTRVIPTDPPHTAILCRANLAEAVKRVGVLASDKTRAVKALFSDDRLELVVTTPELGEAREELPCLYPGPDITIGFNGQFWREALAALASDDVAMAFDADDAGSVLSPVLVRATGDAVDRERLVQVLMPMRMA